MHNDKCWGAGTFFFSTFFLPGPAPAPPKKAWFTGAVLKLLLAPTLALAPRYNFTGSGFGSRYIFYRLRILPKRPGSHLLLPNTDNDKMTKGSDNVKYYTVP
jgi:hypothetical protein